eukprot:TRINITY_DN82216_c0_g1_i1.p1 TRINITY_DN82216_c0_g1~~TRINITY_DN82216_c0_g1_i1.p1  ORF type:complete len:852 (-),score=80.66 TRINITY_DN82216_c0_g1_i1:76-2631(-)
MGIQPRRRWRAYQASCVLLFGPSGTSASSADRGIWKKPGWHTRHGHAVKPREHLGEEGDIVADLSLCFDEDALVNSLWFYATTSGPCLRLLAVVPNDPRINGDPPVIIGMSHTITASSPGNHYSVFGSAPFAVPAQSCLAWQFLGSCNIPFSEDDSSPSTIFWSQELSGSDFNEAGQYKHALSQEKVKLKRPPHVEGRTYSLAVNTVAISLFDVSEDELTWRLELPEWGRFVKSYLSTRDWTDAVAHRHARDLLSILAADSVKMEAFLQRASPAVMKWSGNPASVSAEEDPYVERVHTLIGGFVAAAIEACQAIERGEEDDSGATWPLRWDLASGMATQLAVRFWYNPFLVTEHSIVELDFADVMALASLRPEPGGARSMCTQGPTPFNSFLAMTRANKDLPPPLSGLSWWPVPEMCNRWMLGSRSWPGHGNGLRVVIVETHHADFQEARSLVEYVSEEYFGAPATVSSYLLSQKTDFLDGTSWDAERGMATTMEDKQTMWTINSLREAMELAHGWVRKDDFWQHVDVVFDCNPVWACVALQRLAPRLNVVLRINMALLQYFRMWDELPEFWRWYGDFVTSERTVMSTKNRLIAEQIFVQTGVRPEFVPMVMLHLRGITYKPSQPETLIYKCSHPAFLHFRHILESMRTGATQQGLDSTELVFHVDLQAKLGRPLTFEEMASHRAIVLMPHVPNSCSFADIYAMRIPLLLPAEPYIYRWMWAFSDPFGGHGGDPRKRSRIQEGEPRPRQPDWWVAAGGAEQHKYDPFSFLISKIPMDHVIDQAYWFQYSDYSMLPGLQRFRSIVEVVLMIAMLSDDLAQGISKEMAVAHENRVREVSRWMACTFARLRELG